MIAILLAAIALAGVRVGRPQVGPLLATHLAILAGYALWILAAIRWSRVTWVSCLRPIVAMGTMFTLYATTGQLGMAATSYRADADLNRIDAWLFGGVNPSFFLQRWQTPLEVECFAFFYGWFIPYIYLSTLLGALSRPPMERDRFLTGWVFTYCISYLGYLFLPCQGPGGFLADSYAIPLQGGFFYGIVVTGVANTGGLIGAFPSLHGGSSLYLCLSDLKTNRLRGLTYVPVVIMIYGATLVLRYHYVTDLVAGTIIAVSCTYLGRRSVLHWTRARRAAGLPALPGESEGKGGGEGDVLSDLPGDGRGDTAAVLPAN